MNVQQKVDFYLSAMNRRNIFTAYEEGAESKAQKQPKIQAVKKKTNGLKLVGVSWFDKVDTASAMIEDTKKGITYFLHKGEKIEDITVKTIYADSVELGYKNEEIIIRYDNTQM